MAGSEVSRIVETHVSTLVFVDDRVYKRKKPIRTGFLDFSTLEARREACHLEVELNRRFAPDVYLGVAELRIGGDVLDHLVVMRRLPDDRRLSVLLDHPDVLDELGRVAHLVATVHAAAARGPTVDAASGHGAVCALWSEGLTQIAEFAGDVLDPVEVERAALLAREYLDGRHALFDERVADGHGCDGHGDLQAEDVFCLPDGPRILDCLEFSERFRFGDTLNDVAFLAMDLERLGHPELGVAFLDRYRELSADSWPTSLGHHYVAYRAHVRAKVACIRHGQGDSEAADSARALHAQALRHLEAARVQLVMVGGLPGTGKSSMSVELADRLDATVISSDQVRDELEPRRTVGGNERMSAGRYAPEQKDAVYREMLRRAEILATRGVSAVMDASWIDPEQRQRVRALADRVSTNLTELTCVCPVALAEDRVLRRSLEGRDASEATVAVARHLALRTTPWPEAQIVGTDRPIADSVAEALRSVVG